jgi:hypothetical protein
MVGMPRSMLLVVLLVVAAAAWIFVGTPVLAPWPTASSRVPAARRPIVVPAVHLPQLAAPPAGGPAPPQEGRNPFMAGGAVRPEAPSGSRPARSVAPAAAPVAGPAASAPTATWPRLDLIGVAEAREGAGLMRTAVIAGPRGVHHARPGDLLEQVYRLERITASGVDIRLLPEDRVVHLALRP